MTEQDHKALLGPDDPAPVAISNEAGRSPFLLIGDHAGRAIPGVLGRLGVAAGDLDRHIACDIGIRPLGERLAERLDAVFIHQIYSRLVIDCNRDPAAADAIPPCSDGTDIPGNIGLTPDIRAGRIASIHAVYQQAIAEEIARRRARTQPTILISLHSFTPVLGGDVRPWHVGVLHDGGEDGFARSLIERLRRQDRIIVGDNAPYRMDSTDHTVPRHALRAGLPYAEIEIRQDLLGDASGIAHWAELLRATLTDAAKPPGR